MSSVSVPELWELCASHISRRCWFRIVSYIPCVGDWRIWILYFLCYSCHSHCTFISVLIKFTLDIPYVRPFRYMSINRVISWRHQCTLVGSLEVEGRPDMTTIHTSRFRMFLSSESSGLFARPFLASDISVPETQINSLCIRTGYGNSIWQPATAR